MASGGACVLPEQTCLPPSPALIFTLSLCFSRSLWCWGGGAVFLESPQLGLQSSLLCACPRQEAWPGRGLGEALLPAGGAGCRRGPGLHPPTPPAVLGGRTGLEPGPLEAGPSEPLKGRLSGREGRLCPPQPAARALPQAAALVPVVPRPLCGLGQLGGAHV